MFDSNPSSPYKDIVMIKLKSIISKLRSIQIIDDTSWVSVTSTVCILYLFVWLAPTEPVDPWGILNLNKFAVIIFALAFIQLLGSLLIRFLDSHTSTLVTGFLSGLVSSTALTASLARASNDSSSTNVVPYTLSFLAATLAMLIECIVIIFLGNNEVPFSPLLIFSGPIFITLLMILIISRKHTAPVMVNNQTKVDFRSILKLSVFIILILALSKILQNIFGQNGLIILTFIVSLFEIHGSIAANAQLYDAITLNISTLGILLTVSVASSYISKIFLVFTLGSKILFKQIVKCVGILLLSLAISLFLFLILT